MNKPEPKRYDPKEQSQATTRLVLRVLVAAYIVYLAVGIVRGKLNGETTMSLPVALLIAAAFVAAAVLFTVLAFRDYKKALHEAELPDEDEPLSPEDEDWEPTIPKVGQPEPEEADETDKAETTDTEG